jgi:hypothetical protein
MLIKALASVDLGPESARLPLTLFTTKRCPHRDRKPCAGHGLNDQRIVLLEDLRFAESSSAFTETPYSAYPPTYMFLVFSVSI